MKKDGRVLNRRAARAARNELREAQRIALWLAAGCAWADGPAREEIACAAQAMLGDKAAMLAVYRYAVALERELEQGNLSQSVCSAALYAVRLGEPEWADGLRGRA